MTQAGAEGGCQFQSARYTEYDTDAILVVTRVISIPCVKKRLFGRNHAEQLRGVRRLDGIRGDAELDRGKIDGRQKTAPLCTGVILGGRINGIIVIDPPVIFRNFRYGVHAVFKVGPVGAKVVGPGEDTTDPNNGNRFTSRYRTVSFVIIYRFHFRYSKTRSNSRGFIFLRFSGREIPIFSM